MFKKTKTMAKEKAPAGLSVTRLKLFHQVLLIIILMLGFLGLEGWFGLKNIHSMHQVTQQVFTDTVSGTDAVYAIRDDLNEIEINYLTTLANLPVSQLTTIDLDTNINMLAAFMAGNQADLQIILNEAENLKKLLAAPVSPENYAALSRHLSLIDSALTRLENLIRLTSLRTMARGNEYTANSRRNTIILLVFSAALSIGFSLLMTRSISRPLKKMVAVTDALAAGDLSLEVQVEGSKEMRSIGNGIKGAINGLRGLILRVNRQAESLLAASQEILVASNESKKSAAEVARVMEELAIGASEQAGQINQIVTSMTELADLVNMVSNETEVMESASGKVAATAKLGQQVAGEVAEEINSLYVSTKELGEVIAELNRGSEEINNITVLISDIAEKTALLALNAAIEAARAGEQGRGFAVVAHETSKLANQSKDSAQLIANLIMQMRSRTNHAVEVIQAGIERVEAGRELTVKASGTFGDIFVTLNRILEQINKVAVSARFMAEKNELVLTAINTIAAISEESMASTEEVSATAEEQSAMVEQVTALAENLAAIADTLKQSVAAFVIERPVS